jgi:hypothetical protein
MAVHVRKMNDNNETVIDIKHVVAIRKRVRNYGTPGSINAEVVYFIDIVLNTHPPVNKFELKYSEEAWRDKDYSGVYNKMGLS